MEAGLGYVPPVTSIFPVPLYSLSYPPIMPDSSLPVSHIILDSHTH